MRAALVLDFDNTLAVTMVSHVTKPIMNFGSEARIDLINTFLRSITQQGVDVYILSGNVESIIRAALFHAGISDAFFRAIYGSHSHHKHIIVNDLLRTHDKVIFVDDYPGSFKDVDDRVVQILLSNGPLLDNKMREIKSHLRLGGGDDDDSYSCVVAARVKEKNVVSTFSHREKGIGSCWILE